MSLSAYEAERIQDALDALFEQAAQPVPEMTRRMYEDATAIVAQHKQERPGAERLRKDVAARAAQGHKDLGYVWPPTPPPS